MCISIHYNDVNIRSWVHQDKQVVALILPFSAIKPLQKKRVQQNDVIKRAPVKAQTTGTKGEKRDGNIIYFMS